MISFFIMGLSLLHFAEAVFQRVQIGVEPVKSTCISRFSNLHGNKFIIHGKIGV